MGAARGARDKYEVWLNAFFEYSQFFTTRFLELEDFSESFIDNGYDDLETVALILVPILSQYDLVITEFPSLSSISFT